MLSPRLSCSTLRREFTCSHIRTIAAAISTDSYSSAPLFASPGNDVFDTGSDLPRFATTVRLSGGSGRFACCRAGFYLNFLGPAKFGLCATYGMGFQCLGHARFTRCHYSCDDLRSTCIYGTGLLDSRVLGACTVGYPLHHLRCPYQALARSNVNFGPERDPVFRACPLLEPLPWLASPLPPELGLL